MPAPMGNVLQAESYPSDARLYAWMPCSTGPGYTRCCPIRRALDIDMMLVISVLSVALGLGIACAGAAQLPVLARS